MVKINYLKQYICVLFLGCFFFFGSNVSAEFTNIRAEWKFSCGATIPQVPNKALNFSWDYIPPQGANISNICHITVTDSQGADVWNTDIWCGPDVIEYSGDELIDGSIYSWKVGRLDTNGGLIEESTVCQFQVYEPAPLPSNRPHIRLFRNFPVVQVGHNDIVDFGLDLSFTDGTSEAPDHIALPYDLNTELMTPYLNDPNVNTSQYRKANKLKEWWCNTTGKPCTPETFPDNWFCDDVTACDIPEDMFMHFKINTTITLPLVNPGYYPVYETLTVKGWNPANDLDGDGYISDTEMADPNYDSASGARTRQHARIPSYYWGDLWRYLTGNPVAHRSCFAMAVGNPDYKEFMSTEYVPYVLSIKENADGIYLDDATAAYYKIWQQWAAPDGFVEYGSKGEYITENMKLMKAIKENIPSDKIVIGNGWKQFPHVIDGNQKETAFNISMPYEGFNKYGSLRTTFEEILTEQNRGIITASQFSPANTFDDNYSESGVEVPASVTRARDKIYGLADYYLIAGDRTYFSYGQHPYYDWVADEIFVDATGVDVGQPEGGYFILPGSEEYGQGVNMITNGDFASADTNNDPAGWIISVPEYVEIASEEECSLDINGSGQGSCAKISRDTTVNQWAFYTQWVTLESNTTYTLTGYIRTENINNQHGANIFTYNFEVAGMDNSSDDHLDCGVGPGTNGWQQYYCTFTTETMPAPGNHSGQYGNGTINFRIQGGTGTAWFDNIELREGVSRIALARNYSKSLMLVRPKAGYNKYFDLGYEDPITYSLGGSFFPVNADGSLGVLVNEIMLNNGEAAILIKDSDDDGYPVSSMYGGIDCDDGDSEVNPGHAEICDGKDNNCDGVIDEGFVDTDADDIKDCVDPDDDNDGLLDSDEINVYGTDPLNSDTDADNLNDGDEIQSATNPLHPDTDRDGTRDGQDSEPLNIFSPNPEGWKLSKNSDFSTSDAEFSITDTFHIIVWSNVANALPMKKKEYKIKNTSGFVYKEDLAGTELPLVYMEDVALSGFDTGTYTVEIWLRDDSNVEYEVKDIFINVQ